MQQQKTAMQDLFEIIEKQIGKNFPQEIKEHFIGREKEQIATAFTNGQLDIAKVLANEVNNRDLEIEINIDELKLDNEDGVEYYNNTYENEEKFCVCKTPTLGSNVSKCGTCGEWFKTVH